MNKTFDTLNEKQKEAVVTTEGPLLILAGAGSGKTKTLTHRIAYLIEECDVNPYNIMAITFTNKAAKEMKERIESIVGYGSESIWVCTFHSTCVRILRRFIDRLGYGTNFTIYDTDDQKSVVKNVIKRLNLDSKMYKERSALAYISSNKNELIGPDEAMIMASAGSFSEKNYARIYNEYQATLKKNNAVDFDDLICLTVELFSTQSDVLLHYQERFRYIMVDEYQDTNNAQFKLVSLLAKKYRNLCVVGDDDQSIYKFRGANISNILDFEDTYNEAKVIKLEQNYRSFQNILNAANDVIHNNTGRKDKALWSDKGDGDKVKFNLYNNGVEEAIGIVDDIKDKSLNDGFSYKDFAVLYRTNAQSRTLEEQFVTAGIPYRVFGGVNFYQRKEIKDILAYLKTVDNGKDEVAVKRIINVPKRGIGATSIAKIDNYAIERNYNFYEALEMIEDVPSIGKAADKINAFVDFISVLKSKSATMPVSEFIREIVSATEYEKLIADEAENDEEITDRIGNIEELISKAVIYEKGDEHPSLSGFLEEVALVADIDNMDEAANRVSLMTIHSAKGLEFPAVYLTGMEDGLFPSYMSISSGDIDDIEEERRLCYVGITRAMMTLTMSAARSRMTRGEITYNPISRFVKEISPMNIDKNEAGISNYKPITSKPSFLESQSFGGFSKANAMRSDVFDSKTFERKTFGQPTTSYSKTVTTTYSSVKKGSDMGSTSLEYVVGDRVSHIKFGAGVVKDIKDAGRDFEVTVEFDKVGVKKMFASFAKLKKL